MTNIVLAMKWEESERGWGTRPDGYSFHLTEADYDAYIKAFWDRQPKEVPDEYERPVFGYKLVAVTVPDALYEKIVQSPLKSTREWKLPDGVELATKL